MTAHVLSALVAAWHWFALNLAPWLAVSFIPALITGAANVPKTSGFVPYLQAVIRFCSWATHHDELGTFKAPFGIGAIARFAKKPAAAAALLPFVLLVSSCACWTDQTKANTPACIVVHEVVDCTVGVVEGALPYFAAIVKGLISGGIDPNSIDWNAIGVQAEGMGVKDGLCFLAQLKNLLFGSLSSSPSQLMSVTYSKAIGAFDGYKAKHFPGQTIKVRLVDKKTGHEVWL